MYNIDLDQIRQLSVDERLALIEATFDTLDDDDAEPMDDELRVMLDGRLAAHRAAPETSIAWEDVRARLFALE